MNTSKDTIYNWAKFFISLGLLVASCQAPRKEVSYEPGAGHYRLLSFRSNSAELPKTGSKIHLQVSFATQRDSVFWDSFNNAGEFFEILADSTSNHPLVRMVSKGAEGDSIWLAAPINNFFKYQFGSEQPAVFCKNDTVVWIRYRISKIWQDLLLDQHYATLEEREQEILARMPAPYTDEHGIIWVEGEPLDSVSPAGTRIHAAWKGTYLNGRPLETQPDFEWVVGTPDQILKGLAITLRKMKPGEHAKIILPSSLAFGPEGSSNGVVPPFTPLIYDIQVFER